MAVLRAVAAVAATLSFAWPAAALARPLGPAAGRAWLMIGQGMHGYVLGEEVGRLTGAGQRIELNLGLGATMALSALVVPGVTAGRAAAINAGTLLGALHAVAFAEFAGPRTLAPPMLVGQLLGTGLGVALAWTDPDHRRVATANSVAFWSGLLLYEIRKSRPHADDLYVGVLAADLGWAFGYAAAPDVGLSPGTLARIDLAVAGAWTVGFFYRETAGSTRNAYFPALAVAASLGFGLGLAQPWADRPLTLMPSADGLAVAGQF